MVKSVGLAAAIGWMLASGVATAQELAWSARPDFDEAGTLLFRFDGDVTAEGSPDGAPLPEAKISYAPGRFGQAATLGQGGLRLPAEWNPLFDPNRGTIEFYFKADDLRWFWQSHSFFGNNMNFCQPGNFGLWYWGEFAALRLDLHLPGDCGYLTCQMPEDTEWHHFAVTWDCDSGIRMYVDGRLASAREKTWTGMWIPREAMTLVVGDSLGDAAIDELRISKAARPDPQRPRVVWSADRGEPTVRDGQTVMPVTVTFRNLSEIDRKVDARIAIVDYFQIERATGSLTETIPPGQERSVSFDVPTDDAGPYVKVGLKGTVEQREPTDLADERLVFVDTRTGPRLRFDMNGTWEICDGDPMNVTPPTEATWTTVELPHRDGSWGTTHTKWYRKRFTLPQAMAGKTVELKLSGVRFRADVFLNGQPLGGYDTDQMPQTVDLTETAKISHENELLIAVTDWINQVQPELKEAYAKVAINNSGPGGKPFIRPHGSGVSPAGIIDPIAIVATDPVAIETCYVTPSVREKSLTVKTTIVNRTAEPREVRLTHRMIDKGELVLEGPEQMLTVEPGRSEVTQTIAADLSKLTLWWPGQPYLYRLRSELRDADTLRDRLDTRFGFREFRPDGAVFRINGVAIRPGLGANMPYGFPGFDSQVRGWYETRRYFEDLLDFNIDLVRFHSEPFAILMYDAADEAGLMIASEAIMSSIPCAYNWPDERLWQTLAEYYPRWVFREFNHPSLVVRSMENELGYYMPESGPHTAVGSEQDVRRTRDGMRELGRLVQRLDPSRPIMYDGSGPVFYDVADIYNVHYPGLPGGEKLFPVTSRWISMRLDSYIAKDWLWDRAKPLVVGECDCCLGVTPGPCAAIAGDAVYVRDWHDVAQMTNWPMTVEGQRIDGVSAAYPWTPIWPRTLPFDEATPKLKQYKELIAPLTTLIHQHRRGYFGGREIIRTLTTIDDSLSPQEMTVRWRLSMLDGQTIQEGSSIVSLEPTQMKRTQVTLNLPAVTAPTKAEFVVETLTDGVVRHTSRREFEIFPDDSPTLTLSARFGHVGMDTAVFDRLGVAVKTVEGDLSDLDVLLIDGNAETLPFSPESLDEFIANGGRVVVFGGDQTPAYLPVQPELVKAGKDLQRTSDVDENTLETLPNPGSSATIIFPRRPEHPLLTGLTEDRLRFWREDHLTALMTYEKPTHFSTRTIADCGGGFKDAALLEVAHGNGLIVLNQMATVELFDDQPAARMLLTNLLNYVDAYRGVGAKPLGVVADAKSMTMTFLRSLGVEAYPILGRLGEIADLSTYGALIVEADETALNELNANREALTRFVESGGVVWLHRPTSQHTDLLNSLLPVPVQIRSLTLNRPIRMAARGLAAGVTNESVYWATGRPPYTSPVDPRVAKHYIDAAEGDAVELLADPPVIAAISAGRGSWLIDEVDWENEFKERKAAQSYVRPILANLGLQIRPRDEAAPTLDLGFHPVDIASLCNSGLTGGIWGGSAMGMHKLPTGSQRFGGVEYQIVDPNANNGLACASLYAADHNPQGVREIAIPLDTRAACVNLLVTSLWTNPLSVGTKVANIEITYADGAVAIADVRYGPDVEDWCRTDRTPEVLHPAVVWVGPEFPHPGLYQYVWNNPRPDQAIRRIVLRPANESGFLALFAVTTQDQPSPDQATEWVPGLPVPENQEKSKAEGQ